MPEKRLVMCEVRAPGGGTESEPLVVGVHDSGMVWLELPDGTVWFCPPGELQAALMPLRRAA